MKLSTDSQLLPIIRKKLFSAVIGDVLDSLDYKNQFLPPEIQPLDPSMVIVGRAMPVLETDLLPGQTVAPFGRMLEALDDLRENEIYMATGGSLQYACWGELMSTRAIFLRAAGAVLDGYSRDTNGILKLQFPVFSKGRYAQDQLPRGYVVDFRVGIRIGQVDVVPGNLVFGDLDGIVVIPKEVEKETLSRALEKVDKENIVRTEICRGVSAVEAFAAHGVL